MKIFKLISSVVAITGLALCTSVVQAEPPQLQVSRDITLTGDGSGKVSLYYFTNGNATSGQNNGFGGTFGNGEPNIYVDISASKLPCQGGQGFYALYITIDGGVQHRIFNFNTSCVPSSFRGTGLHLSGVPDLSNVTPEDWFTGDLVVQVYQESDDALDGHVAGQPVLDGTD